jgi:cytochrome c-type biogenesis protein CcmH
MAQSRSLAATDKVRVTRRRSPGTLLALVLVLALSTAATALGAPRASLTDIENDVMCVSCHEPLAVAQSPQAVAERSFISALIAQGQTKAQIERALVAQYGPAVLGKPPAHGFNLTVYVLPAALLIGGIVLLAITLPKWRARARTRPATARPPRNLNPSDARRLDEDLARFDS